MQLDHCCRNMILYISIPVYVHWWKQKIRKLSFHNWQLCCRQNHEQKIPRGKKSKSDQVCYRKKKDSENQRQSKRVFWWMWMPSWPQVVKTEANLAAKKRHSSYSESLLLEKYKAIVESETFESWGICEITVLIDSNLLKKKPSDSIAHLFFEYSMFIRLQVQYRSDRGLRIQS